MDFEENNVSQVGQVDVSNVGDEMPPDAIRRMGVGFFRPIEGHLLVEEEGQFSTQVSPHSHKFLMSDPR